MSKKQLTFDQLEFLKLNYFSGSWETIAKKFNKEFGEKKSADAVRILYGRYRMEDLSDGPAPFHNFNRSAMDKSVKLNVKEGRFFTTGVMPVHIIEKHGEHYYTGLVNQDAFRTVLAQKDMTPILLPMLAHTKMGEKQPGHYDPALTPYIDLFHAEVEFNQNLKVVDALVTPQQIKPLTGMEDYTDESSVILAHPRQHMNFVATGNDKLPHLVASTGVINYPGYQPNRMGGKAAKKHRMGGRIVEVKGDKFFQRKVKFDKKGGYYDVATYYHHEGNKASRVDAFVVGDLHCGQHEEALFECMLEMIKVTKPRRILIHDFVDGLCVNPHLTDIDYQLRPDWAYSLQTEAALVRKLYYRIKAAAPEDCEIIIIGSNHNNFVIRWIKDKRWHSDKVNYWDGCTLALEVRDGRDPLQTLLNIPCAKFLNEDDDYFVNGVQLANHGHIGVNGAKGSRPTVKKTAPKLMTGHTHTPFEEDGHDGLGMMTKRHHGYNRGASTWMPSCGLVHPDGSTQQIIPIKNTDGTYSWRL